MPEQQQQQRARPRGGRKGKPGVPAAPAERRVGLGDRLDALRADPAAHKQLSQRVEDYRRAPKSSRTHLPATGSHLRRQLQQESAARRDCSPPPCGARRSEHVPLPALPPGSNEWVVKAVRRARVHAPCEELLRFGSDTRRERLAASAAAAREPSTSWTTVEPARTRSTAVHWRGGDFAVPLRARLNNEFADSVLLSRHRAPYAAAGAVSPVRARDYGRELPTCTSRAQRHKMGELLSPRSIKLHGGASAEYLADTPRSDASDDGFGDGIGQTEMQTARLLLSTGLSIYRPR